MQKPHCRLDKRSDSAILNLVSQFFLDLVFRLFFLKISLDSEWRHSGLLSQLAQWYTNLAPDFNPTSSHEFHDLVRIKTSKPHSLVWNITLSEIVSSCSGISSEFKHTFISFEAICAIFVWFTQLGWTRNNRGRSRQEIRREKVSEQNEHEFNTH